MIPFTPSRRGSRRLWRIWFSTAVFLLRKEKKDKTGIIHSFDKPPADSARGFGLASTLHDCWEVWSWSSLLRRCSVEQRSPQWGRLHVASLARNLGQRCKEKEHHQLHIILPTNTLWFPKIDGVVNWSLSFMSFGWPGRGQLPAFVLATCLVNFSSPPTLLSLIRT